MSEPFQIEAQGDHQYLVRLEGGGEEVETWVQVTPEVLDGLGIAGEDEETVVRRTVSFLLRHQGVPDFPRIVELEDVVSGYPDFPEALRG
ncbi:hypothetical protein ACI789_17785 [Geodermatophilus sp. SYSU D00965]